jgi:hypothetical protein
MAESLTPATSEAARGLGELVAAHRPRFGPRLARGAAAAAAVAVGLGGLALGLTMARLQVFTGMFFMAVGSALAAVGGVWLQRMIAAMRVRALLFEGGFVWAEPGEARGYRWDQIASVHVSETSHRRGGKVIYRTHSFTIAARDGRAVRLEDGEFDGGEDLGQAIVRAVRRDKAKSALAAALRHETDGRWESALATFDQITAESPDHDIAAEARIHAHRLRRRAAN